MARFFVLFAALCAGCAAPLDEYCLYREGAPDEAANCPMDAARTDLGRLQTPLFGCGAYDVHPMMGVGNHYYDHATGELVAVRYASDTGDGIWYGRRLACEPVCAYQADEALPPCAIEPP
jgi:hypothetical protein